ncbi:MAG: polyphenol oxidase family protein [Acidimicrobiales bacterium]
MVGGIRAAWSDVADGDLRPQLDSGVRLAGFADSVILANGGRPHWLDQVHGAAVRIVTGPPDTGVAPVPGDALVTADPSARLAVMTADCASIALGSEEGVFAAVHAGWRGLLAGVVEETAQTMRSLGASTISGALGPAIHPECYEFAAGELDVAASRLGDRVRGETSQGRPSFDLPAAVAVVLDRAGVRPVAGVDACTACSGRYFSHRARADTGRQALVVWSEGDR